MKLRIENNEFSFVFKENELCRTLLKTGIAVTKRGSDIHYYGNRKVPGWYANIMNTELGPFDTYSEAVHAEVHFLEENLKRRKNDFDAEAEYPPYPNGNE